MLAEFQSHKSDFCLKDDKFEANIQTPILPVAYTQLNTSNWWQVQEAIPRGNTFSISIHLHLSSAAI